jgi:hypothetical protein
MIFPGRRLPLPVSSALPHAGLGPRPTLAPVNGSRRLRDHRLAAAEKVPLDETVRL